MIHCVDCIHSEFKHLEDRGYCNLLKKFIDEININDWCGQ